MQEVEARVNDVSAVDESILAPQRAASDEDRTMEGIALKCTMMLIPLVCRRPFKKCNDRVAYSVAQRFTDHNGFVFEVTLSEVMPVFVYMRTEEVARDAVASWIESHLTSRLTRFTDDEYLRR